MGRSHGTFPGCLPVLDGCRWPEMPNGGHQARPPNDHVTWWTFIDIAERQRHRTIRSLGPQTGPEPCARSLCVAS